MIKSTIKKTAVLIAVAHCQHLFAQTSLLEEVLVTAQKRSESVLDVPISMSAYSGNRLVEIGALDVKDIITRTPGLAGASKDSFIDFLSIRGISSNDFGVGGDPSVAIFQNGVFSGRSGEVLTGMYDIERVEVLRGPQGLLFGRSATAGAIHVVTSKADVEGDISGDVGLGGGERDQLRGDFAVNIPINDALAIRFAGYHSEEDGYVTNIAGGEKLVSHDNDALRFSLAWQSDRASLDLVADYENRKQSPSIYSQLDATGRPITGDDQVVGTNVPKGGRDESEVYNLSLNATFDLTSMELVSITGFRTYDFDYREDPDGSTIDLLEYTQNQDGDYISQEFKLVSTTQDNLQWFIGVSGFRDKINADFAMASGEETLCELFVGLPCEDFIPGFVPNPNGMVEMGTAKGETWGASIYGDISYAFNEHWTAKAGLRASYDDKEYTITSAPVISELTDTIGRIGTLYAFQTDEPVKSSESWSYVNPRVVVEYTANESWMFYGSATNGTKPGAFDNFAVTDVELL
ncbi:MAG: TonB-dependent receptor, partial [Pseudomonadota bacterium]